MKIALFDMDGTLTEARQKISPTMIKALYDLSGCCKIGIVTGSDMCYVKEQLLSKFISSDFIDDCLQLFPCNGTQVWQHHDGKPKQTYYHSMIDEIGEERLKMLCEFLVRQQLVCMSDFPEMPATGDFIVNRGSMLNYCPPGRSCSMEQRKKFVNLDIQRGLRLSVFRRLKTFIDQAGLGCSAALGGSTSIDIYPTDWDKTYVLRHFNDVEKISFIGDRCKEGGNDKALYDAINSNPNGMAFETQSTKQTIDIINSKLFPYFTEEQ